MKKISDKTLARVSRRTEEGKKHFMIYVPFSEWNKFEKEVKKTGMPVSRYIHAMILEWLEEKEE